MAEFRLIEPDPAGSRGGVAEDVARLLSVLPTASIVIAADGTVLRTSARAQVLGLVNRGRVTVPGIAELAELVARDGVARAQELRTRRPPLGREMLDLRLRAVTLSSGAVLVLADDLAEERRVDAVRRDFVANVSHELKTPVGALILLAEAAQSASNDPQQIERFAERMQSEARRLAHLIQDVIALSRLQGDGSLVDAEPVHVDGVVRGAVNDVRMLAEDKQIELVVDTAPGARVFGDREQLQSAVRNLLTNAIAYSPEHTRVAARVGLADDIVEITVKDQGIGIPASDVDRIFERFYRVDPARSRESGGTGLGLAIVKHACQNHGGECTVWSEPGVGSSFTMRLPALIEPSLLDGLEEAPAGSADAAESAGAGQ